MRREIGSSEVDLRRVDHQQAQAAAAADWTAPDVLVIGGAAAGLTAAACLLHSGVENVMVLEKGGRPGDNWKRRVSEPIYDSTRCVALHTRSLRPSHQHELLLVCSHWAHAV